MARVDDGVAASPEDTLTDSAPSGHLGRVGPVTKQKLKPQAGVTFLSRFVAIQDLLASRGLGSSDMYKICTLIPNLSIIINYPSFPPNP